MMHKFKIGQTMEYTAGFQVKITRQSFRIVQCLPERDGELQYRIKSADEGHERVVRESELRRA
jgi:hypothetical protein